MLLWTKNSGEHGAGSSGVLKGELGVCSSGALKGDMMLSMVLRLANLSPKRRCNARWWRWPDSRFRQRTIQGALLAGGAGLVLDSGGEQFNI